MREILKLLDSFCSLMLELYKNGYNKFNTPNVCDPNILILKAAEYFKF